MKEKGKVAALIVAGGNGERFGGDVPKQYLTSGGKTVLQRTYEIFANNKNIDVIQIVISENHQGFYSGFLGKITDKSKLLPVCFGGGNRQESVRLGLGSVKEYGPEAVLIHDAARPFVSNDLINKVIKNLGHTKCVIPALKISDSAKEVENNFIKKSLLRENLVTVQTPQGFDFDLIYKLHQDFKDKNLSDDSWVVELAGEKVLIIEGEKSNIKITTAEDMSEETRIGNGFDVHQFKEGDGIILCGIKIPFSKSLKGHSDADCAWHALTDAILGAIGEGDIGEHFSDKDPKWKDTNSEIFLKHAVDLLKERNGRINNVDITIICEQPKMKDHKFLMKKNTARVLDIPEDRINIKATTTEKLGFLGRGEGLASQAVVAVTL